MIVGLGTDIVELTRIDASLQRLGDAFAQRILTADEYRDFTLSKGKSAFLAKRFCIKEAAAKALGTGIGRGVSWQHMWIDHTSLGAPLLSFSEGALRQFQTLGGNRVLVSVSDEKQYAVATVVLES